MTRRKPGKRRAPSRKRTVSCRALMVIDSSKIRKKTLTDYRRSRTTFEKAERELAEYETLHLPEYQNWVRHSCGPLMEEIKDVQRKADLLEMRFNEVYAYAEIEGISATAAAELYEKNPDVFAEKLAAARERVMEKAARAREREEKRQLELYKFVVEELEKILRELIRSESDWVKDLLEIDGLTYLQSWLLDESGHTFKVEPYLYGKIFREPFWERLLEEAGIPIPEDENDEVDEEDEFDFFDFLDANTLDADPEEDTLAARVKALKRELAFALHPDQCDGHSPQKLELWHQVQEAAAEMDLDRLEVLQAHVQAMDGNPDPKTPVSRMQMLVQMYRESRNALRRRIRSLRKLPSWDFANLSETERSKLRRAHEKSLREEKKDFEGDLRMLEEEWARLLKPQRRTVYRSAPDPNQMDFDFF